MDLLSFSLKMINHSQTVRCNQLSSLIQTFIKYLWYILRKADVIMVRREVVFNKSLLTE